jgi:hypothetical protein
MYLQGTAAGASRANGMSHPNADYRNPERDPGASNYDDTEHFPRHAQAGSLCRSTSVCKIGYALLHLHPALKPDGLHVYGIPLLPAAE